MLKNIKNIVVVSLSTVGSRLLGLLRDILIFAALGTSLWNSAFILAFTLPNLFRRLLGEGALTSAIVPVFSDVLEREGREGAFRFFNQVLLRLLLALILIVGVGMLFLAWAAGSAWLPERWVTGAGLAVWLLPYMFFICLAAIISAGLNLVGRFAVAASTPILLNLAMIAALLAGLCLDVETARIVYWLCGGVLLGGALQLIVPALDLMRQGWRPRLEAPGGGELAELWRLFLPGLMGAAILQVNILVSRLLAYSLDESAVSVLYLSSRLMELPLGVFTIAVATVFFPLLARALSSGDEAGFSSAFLQGMRLVVGISLPAGVGLLVLGKPILEFLFLWGAFEQADVLATVPLLAIYGLGLPLYSAATFATRGLHASKDMRTPVRVAGCCLLINLLSGLLLMQFWGAAGLATANVLAALVQSVLLWRALASGRAALSFGALWPALLKICLSGVVMGLVCAFAWPYLAQFDLGEKLSAAVTVLLCVPGGILVYLGMLYCLRFEELSMLKEFFVRYLPQRSLKREE
ncbi:murein biosynthesis integral membrane protein MurJ [Coraliomargarita sp. SDUM461004]|uniref:Probable lipid II flippase MurJ n=1 Tax=Thalassobacterium sedimentorum TaxID=3041258 RepID=A0ABU1AHW8_9BACT|nr:murein biosynthesis integral membrane protein MurJ [Coraliomargarita sp. SDUM461004]MDQ8193465.1 murein biosynthesis integral membrane protein MurJ [Coraliomargarita sp. SDUM461004]